MSKAYIVHGIKHRDSSFNTDRVDYLYRDQHEQDVRFFLHYGNLTDSTNLIRIIQVVQPDELYNLEAQSHVAVSCQVLVKPRCVGWVKAVCIARIAYDIEAS